MDGGIRSLKGQGSRLGGQSVLGNGENGPCFFLRAWSMSLEWTLETILPARGRGPYFMVKSSLRHISLGALDRLRAQVWGQDAILMHGGLGAVPHCISSQ